MGGNTEGFIAFLREKKRRKELAKKRFQTKRLPRPLAPDPQALPTDPLLGTAQDEEGLDAVLLEVGIALATTAWLHLIVSIQVVERGLGDVDAPMGGEGVSESVSRELRSDTSSPLKEHASDLTVTPAQKPAMAPATTS